MSDTLRYPAFLLVAAGGVLSFFLLVVLPQFANVFQDFNAKLDPVLVTFLGISNFLRKDMSTVLIVLDVPAVNRPSLGLGGRRVRARVIDAASRLPLVRPVLGYGRTALFCRNLGLLLASGVTLPASLRVLADMMATSSDISIWTEVVDKVRQGGKLSDALAQTRALPSMAVRTLRLGRGFRATVDAGRTRRGRLRRQAATQPRPAGRDNRPRLDHRHQHDRRRSYRIRHDRPAVGQSNGAVNLEGSLKMDGVGRLSPGRSRRREGELGFTLDRNARGHHDHRPDHGVGGTARA